MGTNYYARRKDSDFSIHIGKSSSGWTFLLRTHEQPVIKDIKDWTRILLDENYTIYDEYNNPIEYLEFLSIVMDRKSERSLDGLTKEFFDRNYCVPDGINNLLRPKLDGNFCVARGAGTWDLVKGEFS